MGIFGSSEKNEEDEPIQLDSVFKYKFKCPCPCCPNNEWIFWVHHKCGGHEKMDDYGNVKCVKCGVTNILLDWSFRCKFHANEFKKYDPHKILNIMAIIGNINGIDEEDVHDIYERIWAEHMRRKKEAKMKN